MTGLGAMNFILEPGAADYIQGGQLNIAVVFLYLVKSDLSFFCTRVHWTSHFIQGTRKKHILNLSPCKSVMYGLLQRVPSIAKVTSIYNNCHETELMMANFVIASLLSFMDGDFEVKVTA